jgi:hypothetical protein
MTIVEVLRMQAGHPLELTPSLLGSRETSSSVAARLRMPDSPYGHADAPCLPVERKGFT